MKTAEKVVYKALYREAEIVITAHEDGFHYALEADNQLFEGGPFVTLKHAREQAELIQDDEMDLQERLDDNR